MSSCLVGSVQSLPCWICHGAGSGQGPSRPDGTDHQSLSRKQALRLERPGVAQSETQTSWDAGFSCTGLTPLPGCLEMPALSPGIRRDLGTVCEAKECPTHSIWSHFLPGRRRKEKEEIQPPPTGACVCVCVCDELGSRWERRLPGDNRGPWRPLLPSLLLPASPL